MKQKRIHRMMASLLAVTMLFLCMTAQVPVANAAEQVTTIPIEHYYPGVSDPVEVTTNISGSSSVNLLDAFVEGSPDPTTGTGFVRAENDGTTYDLDRIELCYDRYPVEIRYYDGTYVGVEDNFIGSESGYGEHDDLISSYFLSIAELGRC